MRRVLSLHVPHLSIDLAQRRRARAGRRPGALPTSCLLLTHEDRGRTLVVQRCSEAARRGIRVGLTLGEAQALIDPRVRARHGDPWVEELQPARDGRALHALGAWCMAKVSPVVALDPPDGLFMDVAGTGRLLGDEEDVCRALLRAMHRFGLGARLAVADTVGAAWALSHFGRTPRQLVETGDEEAVLAPLPVESLRLEPATAEGLAELGVRSVGELVRLDRARVAARFGGDVGLRLDQALGRAFEAVTPLVHETPPQRERTFEGPVKALEGILETAESLVGELAAELLRARRGALELVLVLEPSDLPPRSIPLTLARPSASGRHLWTMLEPKVAGAHLGFGIERVRVSAVRTGRLPSRQVGAWGAEDEDGGGLDRDMGELVDVLRARLGEERVLTPAPRQSHLPERAYGWERPGEGSARRAPEASSAAPLPPRPSRLFDPPEPAVLDALDERGAPRRLRWRGIAYRVRHARGPERIARPWWEDGEHTLRDYFRLETACGRTLWAYREPRDGRGFVQGEWT